MRIAMISYHTCPLASLEGKETGGMNVYVLELSRALARRGHHVDVYTRSHEENDALITTPESNLRVMHLTAGAQTQLPKKKLVRFIPKFVGAYKSFVQKQQVSYEAVHAHYYQSGLAAQSLGQPFIMSFHTLGLMKNLVARDATERENSARIRAEFRLTKLAHTIVASSESDRAYMEYLYDVPVNKIAVITPGIDISLFHPMEKNEARRHIHADPKHKIVLYVGRVEPLKGLDSLLYAIKILTKQYPKETVCLWIVGDKSPRALANIQQTLSLSTNVRFVGWQKQTELPYYYNGADVVVMPSHYESFGLSALEALGCNVPVITTNVTGISNLMSDEYASIITSVNNPLLLASQIQKVLTNTSAVKQTKIIISKHQWSNVAARMLSVYKSVKIPLRPLRPMHQSEARCMTLNRTCTGSG
jgi:D-inositol-3-phosphate glycosyltransferase